MRKEIAADSDLLLDAVTGAEVGLMVPIDGSELLTESNWLWVAAPVAGIEKETLPVSASD
jgi:hypothetical protein